MSDLMQPGQLLRMARHTVSNPRDGAAVILKLHLPMRALWLAFGLGIVLSMFLGETVALLMGPPDQAAMPPEMMVSPITMGVIQAAFLFLVAHGIARIGQLFGGSVDFQGALALIVWLQFIFLVVQVIQLAAMLVVPPMFAAQLSDRLPVRFALVFLHAALSSLLGYQLSVWLNCSPAGAMVVVGAMLFLLAWAVTRPRRAAFPGWTAPS